MLIRPVDYFLIAWFALAAASTIYVAWDQYRNNPEPVVMKWGFILVTLYMGPLGLLLYVMADKEPRPGEHETFIAPLWKQGRGLNDPLRCRRRDRHHSGCGHYRDAWVADVVGPHRRVRRRICIRTLHLSIAVHEVDDGRDVLGERSQIVPA